MAAFNYSRQREAIVLNLRQRTDHPTAEMIYTDIRMQFPKLSLGTVYRNLTLLSDRGDITRLSALDGADRFDARTDRHDHFVCHSCGAVLDLPPSDYTALICNTQKTFPGLIEDCRVLYRGICVSCRKG